MKSKKDWSAYGDEDPFYGVLSEEKYKYKNLDESGYAEFYKTGFQYVEETNNRIFTNLGQDISDKNILDFGCGVGRLALPFAKKSTGKVTGLDVAPGMVKIANEQKEIHQVRNLSYQVYSGSEIPDLGTFDLVNSYIVIQHIEPVIGFSLVDQLCKRAKIGGIVHLQIPFGHNIPKLQYMKFYLKVHSNLYNRLTNLAKTGKFRRSPVMQMNYYQPEKLGAIFDKYTDVVHTEATDHGGHLGNFYFFSRTR